LLTPRMMNVFHIPYGGIKIESSKIAVSTYWYGS
jgi:hypothetical protein